MQRKRIHRLFRSAIVVIFAAVVADYVSVPSLWLQARLTPLLGSDAAYDAATMAGGADVVVIALVMDALVRGAKLRQA